MDLSFTPEDIAFRDEVRAFIDEAFDDDLRAKVAASRNGYLSKDDHVRWQKKLHERGWAAPNWPVEHGGCGWSASQKYIFETEMAAANTPNVIPFGLKMVAPVIMAFGSEAQKKRFLPDILATNVWWCQGYSEPGSGSDLASLQMKAEDKGDHYLCNGSKIWTSYAQVADWIFCLVRTEKTAKPQEGISFILIDMKSPGIKVDPIYTIDMPRAGMQEVNQVFFDDVKVPKENLIGEVNKGWTYAKYLLEFERGNAYSGRLKRALNSVRKIAAAEEGDGRRVIDDMSFRMKLAETEIAVQALEMTELRILSRLSSGQRMGPESSLMKCRGSELQQDVSSLALEASGLHANAFDPGDPASNEPPIGPDYAAKAAPSFFNLRKVSIYAGSNEIQRNIMAKLILGL
ncbi:acyl-CoA dehydrogenase family protein [Oceanibacterium hippocampi]|uniref:Glutaryl-CoA dehydrogenase n=1 Tax=Oceanibacterium hippocampi TaxID=745714 RepID=A0A1Y5SCP8_9PROT|nr:acyl-CoA dehydrogenase family protein [Oceanibacterium hippocampi]SLN34595.1 Glutaryl-CoA dehydrogenase [Oceanibacterium hippocampi]